ncbi:UNVERIFIED_ORG: hypothetical protein ABIB19_003844, partial [Arthrobacter sp. UYEF10]
MYSYEPTTTGLRRSSFGTFKDSTRDGGSAGWHDEVMDYPSEPFARVGIIGGTGLYRLPGAAVLET